MRCVLVAVLYLCRPFRPEDGNNRENIIRGWRHTRGCNRTKKHKSYHWKIEVMSATVGVTNRVNLIGVVEKYE